MAKFYALINRYADDYSVGFANTGGAYAFESRAQREEWLETGPVRASRPCTRKEALRYAYRAHWGVGEPKYLYNPITGAEVLVSGGPAS